MSTARECLRTCSGSCSFKAINYTYDVPGTFFRAIGVTQVAGITYGQVTQDLNNTLDSAKRHAVDTCYENAAVPYGSVDFTVEALAIKHSKCQAVYSPMVDSSDIALATALKDVGVKIKQVYATGYDQTVLSNPAAVAALNGAYFETTVNMTTPNKATQAMVVALKRYDPSYKGGLPHYGTWSSYVDTDLLLAGVQAAGTGADRATVMASLSRLRNYDAGGILPNPVSFTNFGTPRCSGRRTANTSCSCREVRLL